MRSVSGNTSCVSIWPRGWDRRLLPVVLAVVAWAFPALAQDVLMHHNDLYRTGVQSHETQLTPATINTVKFGKLFSMRVDGQVYAQPLWVGSYTMNDGKAHNVLFVATQNDSVYAFDADGKGPEAGYYWHVSLLDAGESPVTASETGCTDITPQVGITGTPVINRALGVLYVVSKSRVVSGNKTTYFQRLHALSLSSGREMMNGPVEITASVPGTGYDAVDGVVSFNPLTENQRSALTLNRGTVWIAWASHGDDDPYHGWLLGYNESDLTKQTGVFNDSPNGQRGGIWMSAGGISADSDGNLYLASGNGTYDANAGGEDYGSTVFKFTPVSSATASNGLKMATSFTPDNQEYLSSVDSDMGTSACTLIDNPGAMTPHLLVTTDKDGWIYLLDRDKMGGYTQNKNEDLQEFSNGGGNFHQNLAFFNNQIYVAPDGLPLSAWKFDAATGLFDTQPVTAPDSTYGCGGCDGSGATVSISASGSEDGMVWAIDNSGYNSTPAVLHAYDAGLKTELYNSTWAAGLRDQADIAVKFTTPTIANGFVYVGGGSSVTVYGLFSNGPMVADPPEFSPAPGAETAEVKVVLTDKTPGAKVHYTLDGTEPGVLTPVYVKPFSISTTTEVKAMAEAPGYVPGPSSGGVYLFGTPGDIFGFNKGFPDADLVANGSAKALPTRIQLTDGGNNEAGSVYYRTPVKIANFTVNFDFAMTNAVAHGFTFVLQNQGLTALGPDGGGLGYGPPLPKGTAGISPSAAIKFDLFNSDGEGIDSTGFYVDGASPTVPSVNLTPSTIDLHSGHIFSVELTYNGVMVTEFITDTVTGKKFHGSYPVNLATTLGASAALIGFTGSSGGIGVTTNILNWSFSNPTKELFAATGLTAKVEGPALVASSDPLLPDGKGVLFPATAVGQSVSFTVTVAADATFAVNLQGVRGTDMGIMQLAIDGKNFGSAVDGYTTAPSKLNVTYGSLLLTAGSHAFTYKVTGKNPGSTGYEASFGEITLEP
jgi:hypothetical protein